jgi:hypothetical protein
MSEKYDGSVNPIKFL